MKSLLTITHKGNRELGNSDPSLLEFKAFALSYNSTLPLYPNPAENQNKGLNQGFSCSFIITKQSEQQQQKKMALEFSPWVSIQDRYSVA